MDEEILEPVNVYGKYKNEVHTKAETFISDLINKDPELVKKNEEIAKKYEQDVKDYKYSNYRLSGLKKIRVGMWALFGIGLALLLTGIILLAVKYTGWGIALMVIGFSAALVGVLVYALYISKEITYQQALVKKNKAKSEQTFKECQSQIRQVTDELDWDFVLPFIKEGIPTVKFHDYYTLEDYDTLYKKYRLGDCFDPKESKFAAFSGEIAENPFLLYQSIYTFMGTATYTGSITVQISEEVQDEDGWHTEYHNEVLTATIEKPKPYFYTETILEYGNEAAPNLKFSRDPHLIVAKNPANFFEAGEKELYKYADQSLKKGKKFTPMANTKFETMFHAYDRNNETEFRLLFTPLAQENLLDLATDSPISDNYSFRKDGCRNIIREKFVRNSFLCNDATGAFVNEYSFKHLKDDFIQCVDTYFQDVFFCLAPILSIPLYQQYRPHKSDYNPRDYKSNYTTVEHEIAANTLDLGVLAHRQTQTDVILKTKFNHKEGKTDYLTVTAYSYKIIPQIEYVSERDSEGNWHDIPVKWDEYIPLLNRTTISVTKTDLSRSEYLKKCETEPPAPHSVMERGFLVKIEELRIHEEELDDDETDDFISHDFNSLFN